MTIAMKQLIQQTAVLTSDEQLELAALLIEQARRQTHPARRSWLDVAGAAPYPLTDGDAQAWVTQTRTTESDEREQQWRQTE